MTKILLVDDEISFLNIYKKILKKNGYEVVTANNGLEALDIFKKQSFNLIISDMVMPKMDGLQLLKEVNKQSNIPMIILTGKGSIELAVKAIKEGAYTFLSKPVNIDEFLIEIEKCLNHQRLRDENQYLKEQILEGQNKFLGEAESINDIKKRINIVAKTDSTVLIRGESGTGKELVAELIHKNSLRKGKPFIKVNCAALSENILESELFGHEKGAFTGALYERKGRFELANKGTIFLDEIGDISLDMQTKLLRVIQEKEFERVGSSKTIKTDFRLIAATNRNLEREIEKGNFREDLYYRINVIPICVPPLRERKEDIILLFNYFVGKFSKEMRKDISNISEKTKELLISYNWPGNVRELKNICERLVVFTQGDTIDESYLPMEFFNKDESFSNEKTLDLKEARDNFEKKFIQEALIRNKGNISKTAEEIGIARKNLYEKINKYDLEK
ncbi:sigma-54 dependent transcriptional regulator [Anaerosalibacter bizertensis]|uniref:sigma-54-dependent transcriptional regulator n=1 Tax=Anaerosalibacter bizertensis TaxID=932217 RepID=UPI001C0EE394|nr:sigma-54 dependent transcriptional regulator [Anaerosalibacter bizertensis]MBU5294586.1 sigma-54 dependent transcriptional regulator [Anaerosalibacter bizertensis]